MTMRKIRNCFFALCIFCCLVQGGAAMAETYAAPADVLNKAGMSAEEVRGVDLEKLIRRNNIIVQDLPLIDAQVLRQVIEEAVAQLPVSMMYLFADDAIDSSVVKDWTKIRKVALRIVESGSNWNVLADFEANALYNEYGLFFRDVSQYTPRELTDGVKQEIIRLLEEADVMNWTTGTTNNEMHQEWDLVIEFDEGIVRFKKLYADRDTLSRMTQLGISLMKLAEGK